MNIHITDNYLLSIIVIENKVDSFQLSKQEAYELYTRLRQMFNEE